jgi:histidinol-phosphatase (PHP family)
VYREESLRLCRTAKELGIPLEFNIHGLLCEKNYPCEKFFKIAAEVGNEVIIGLDAHSPKEISDLSGYNKGLEILKNWGVTNIIETVDLVNPF